MREPLLVVSHTETTLFSNLLGGSSLVLHFKVEYQHGWVEKESLVLDSQCDHGLS